MTLCAEFPEDGSQTEESNIPNIDLNPYELIAHIGVISNDGSGSCVDVSPTNQTVLTGDVSINGKLENGSIVFVFNNLVFNITVRFTDILSLNSPSLSSQFAFTCRFFYLVKLNPI
ncbi:hypothetical protein AYI68_g2350 [Smittium mucronatum]|uniref:Uncharacterized protein n=1 Tax=Smittium mucronatum TaxID=133383 RepID=A0A1R0H2Z9_9FUNG|nr:hypothetical protein AYI68_g2350 [Smittium mucronatum]